MEIICMCDSTKNQIDKKTKPSIEPRGTPQKMGAKEENKLLVDTKISWVNMKKTQRITCSDSQGGVRGQ